MLADSRLPPSLWSNLSISHFLPTPSLPAVLPPPSLCSLLDLLLLFGPPGSLKAPLVGSLGHALPPTGRPLPHRGRRHGLWTLAVCCESGCASISHQGTAVHTQTTWPHAWHMASNYC